MRCPGTPTHPLKYPQVPQGPDATPRPPSPGVSGRSARPRAHSSWDPAWRPSGAPRAPPSCSQAILGPRKPRPPGHQTPPGCCRSRRLRALQIRLWSWGAQCATRVGGGELWGFSTFLLVSVFSGPFSGRPHPHPDTGRRGELSGLRLLKRCRLRLLGVLRGPPRRSLQLPPKVMLGRTRGRPEWPCLGVSPPCAHLCLTKQLL